MNSIRIKSQNVTIEVNDNGDTIVLPFDDQQFPIKVFNVTKQFEKFEKQITKEFDKIESVEKRAEKMLEFHQKSMDLIDEAFGKDTCLKVFGDIIPSAEMISEFFEAIQPYFEKHQKRVVEKSKKYSPKRKGNA